MNKSWRPVYTQQQEFMCSYYLLLLLAPETSFREKTWITKRETKSMVEVYCSAVGAMRRFKLTTLSLPQTVKSWTNNRYVETGRFFLWQCCNSMNKSWRPVYTAAGFVCFEDPVVLSTMQSVIFTSNFYPHFPFFTISSLLPMSVLLSRL